MRRALTGLLSGAALALAVSVVPTVLLEGISWFAGAPFSGARLASRWGFVLAVLAVARLTSTRRRVGGRQIVPQVALGLVLIGTIVGVYVTLRPAWAAWGLMAVAYVVLLALERYLTADRGLLRRWGWRGVCAVVAGALPVAISQIESRFADEEFFVIIQAGVLGVFWLALLGGTRVLSPGVVPRVPSMNHRSRGIVPSVFLLLILAGSLGVTRAYQRSFYPPDAPSYPGISREQPFLCGEAAADAQVYDGEDVFRRLLALIEKNPWKGSPEYGMLALATGDDRWAEVFHQSLLAEVAEGRFTDPAHSIKSVQHEAALRAYYYPRVRDRFPGLFSQHEIGEVGQWFAAINRRALTVEWVDLMYALAFAKWPEGPYENQESGAGLLALLESEGLADPELSPRNRDYLARNPRGWLARFRVTDDAVYYHPEWIQNAYFQSLYRGQTHSENLRLSLEWLLAQGLPDGSPLRYNHPVGAPLAGVAYLGARWLNDPRFIWLAGRAVEALERSEYPLGAQPGLEQPVKTEGMSPSTGSCLLYGDSGLPNHVGPLAPDKIVFRDSWASSSAYLLLNLRFSGWHRYKATNTITLVYQESPLSADVLEGEAIGWLPRGRSLFRDKRIPRENLNGLLVERTGMSAVLYDLTGIGGAWAQDPPYYTEVMAFETSEEVDWAHTRMRGWRGWEQNRWVYFYHGGGPTAIVDVVKGPIGHEAALVWHFAEGEKVDQDRFILREGSQPVSVVLVPGQDGGQIRQTGTGSGGDGVLSVMYDNPSQGELGLVTVFLPNGWLGAEVRANTRGGISIQGANEEIKLSFPPESYDSTG